VGRMVDFLRLGLRLCGPGSEGGNGNASGDKSAFLHQALLRNWYQ
jgi:hypothetical protein